MAEVALAFHDVGPGSAGDRFTITPDRFARLVAAIAQDAAQVVVTFDDGFRSAHEVAAPILESHGLRGVFFVITKDIGKPRCLDETQIRELHAAGHTISSHTHTHPRNPFLKDLPLQQIEEEWRRSRAILEDVTESPVLSGSVPYGFHGRRVAEGAAAAGYTDLYASHPATEPSVQSGVRVHGRFSMVADTRPEHVAALCRVAAGTILLERVRYGARTVTKRVLGPGYVKARREILARRHR